MSKHTDTSKNTKHWAVSQRTDTSKNTEAMAVSQHTGTSKNTDAVNTKAWAVSQQTDTSKNTTVWAVSQHTDTSKNAKVWAVSQHIHTSKNTKSTLGCCYALHSYVETKSFEEDGWLPISRRKLKNKQTKQNKKQIRRAIISPCWQCMIAYTG